MLFAEDLRKAVLRSAMQGKITEQLSTDGEIEELLDKLVFDDKLGEIAIEEVPCDIPKAWRWVRIGNLGKSLGTESFSDGPFGSNLKKEHQTLDKEVRIIQLSNIGESGWRDENEKYTTYSHLDTIARCEVQAGDFVIAKMMPAGRTIIVPDLGTRIVLGSDAVKFVPNEVINKQYLLWAMHSDVFLKQVVNDAHGITRVRTSLGKLKTFLLPIPPFKEQQRIVEKLDVIMKEIDEYEAMEKTLVGVQKKFPDDMKKAVLQYAMQGKITKQSGKDSDVNNILISMYQEKERLIETREIKRDNMTKSTIDEVPFDIPSNWCWTRLGKISRLVTKGTTPRGGNVAYENHGIGFLRAENVQGLDKLDKRKLKFVDEETHNGFLSRSKMEENDLLITIAGTLGRTAIVRKEDLPLNANQAVAIVRLIDSCKINLKYVIYAMNSPLLQKEVLVQKKKTAIPNLTLEIIANMPIPIPPIEEQQRIVERLEQILPLIDDLKE